MDQELKAKWVAALRSGEWKQCKYSLRSDCGYCCLGVLTKLVTGEEPGESWGYKKPDELAFIDEPVPGDLTVQNVLVSMNDGLNQPARSFAEIADYIEKNL